MAVVVRPGLASEGVQVFQAALPAPIIAGNAKLYQELQSPRNGRAVGPVV